MIFTQIFNCEHFTFKSCEWISSFIRPLVRVCANSGRLVASDPDATPAHKARWKYARPATDSNLRLLQTNTVAGDCLFCSKRNVASWTEAWTEKSSLLQICAILNAANILIRQCSTLHHIKGSSNKNAQSDSDWKLVGGSVERGGKQFRNSAHGSKPCCTTRIKKTNLQRPITSTSGLFPEGENVPGFGAFLALRWRCRGGVWWGQGCGRWGGRGGLWGGGASIGAALWVWVFSRTFHSGDVAAVPHPWATQFTEVM